MGGGYVYIMFRFVYIYVLFISSSWLKKNCNSPKNSKNSTDTTIHQYYVDEKCSN